jgi:hypothetical protein
MAEPTQMEQVRQFVAPALGSSQTVMTVDGDPRSANLADAA